jgi:hypothetical protein
MHSAMKTGSNVVTATGVINFGTRCRGAGL